MAQRYKSIFQTEFEQDFCYRCGRYAPEHWHHIFNASNKKRSEKYGAMIKVCWKCHRIIHDKEMKQTKQKAERKMLEYYGWSEQDFIDIFGKNYL